MEIVMKKDEKKKSIPTEFWTKKKPMVNFKETLEDISPINWNIMDNERVIVHSSKEMIFNKND